MEPLKFSTKINASSQKVWDTLWNDTTYRQWVAVFMEGSYAQSDWKEGSKILFLGAKGDGMFGIIEKNIPHEQMTFRHIGEVKDGIEKPMDWGEAKESYHLKEKNGITELDVQLTMTLPPDFEKYFKETFPKALKLVKEISEK